MKCVTKINYFFLFVLSFLFISFQNCRPDSSAEQDAIHEIIESHFREFPVLENLMPAVPSEKWIKGKMKTYIHPIAGEREMPPPPPIDTVLFSQRFFDDLVAASKLSPAESDEMQKHLIQVPQFKIISASPSDSFELITREIVNPKREKGESFSIQFPSHYSFSQPLFNADKTKVLLRVDRHVFFSGRGHFYLFARNGNDWIISWDKMSWIE